MRERKTERSKGGVSMIKKEGGGETEREKRERKRKKKRKRQRDTIISSCH